MNSSPQFIAINEDGFPFSGESHLSVEEKAELLSNVHLTETGEIHSQIGGKNIIIEAFDEPLVAKRIYPPTDGSPHWQIEAPFQVKKHFILSKLRCDEWDRFHGLTLDKAPFILSRPCQDRLFSLMDSFDDDSVTYQGERYFIQDWIGDKAEVENGAYWNHIYQTEEPGWNLGQPAPALIELLPRFKLPLSRVLVLGCGFGHDAAFFAQQGHIVTAVDISPEALQQAKTNYPQLNINWVLDDIFQLPSRWQGQFDLIFEHTCYCAINPARRQELVQIWRKLLVPQGQLLAILFAAGRLSGPPFGGSEWEIRKRLGPYFQFLLWKRWRQSLPRRQGRELVVYGNRVAGG